MNLTVHCESVANERRFEKIFGYNSITQSIRKGEMRGNQIKKKQKKCPKYYVC